MVQVLDIPQDRNSVSQLAGQGLGNALGGGLQAFMALQQRQQQMAQQKQQNEAIQRLLGHDVSGLSSDLQKTFVQEMLKSQGKQQESQFAHQIKEQERIQPLQNALQTLERQKQLLASGHLGPAFSPTFQGRKAGSTFSPEGQKTRAEYSRLGKSLIAAAAPLIIRNKAEFEKYAEGISDPSASQAEIEGNIKGLERIIRQNMGEKVGDENELVAIQHNGETYDIPAHLVPLFKQKHGIR